MSLTKPVSQTGVAPASVDEGELAPPVEPLKAYFWLATLVLAYIGVYICRKNLSVAIPLIQAHFHVTRSELGIVASMSTVAYAVGKVLFGPVVDRFGGRICLLFSLLLVAVFGGLGAIATSVSTLTMAYSANRLAGAASWPAMVKQLPDWFSAKKLPFAVALLSLGYVFGGVCASLLAGQIAEWSGNNWRMVMGGPSLVLGALALIAWLVLPRPVPAPKLAGDAKSGFSLKQVGELLRFRQFQVVCALSFSLTLMRETFNTWTVDFFKTEGGAAMSMKVAAFLSTPFDALGAVGIVWLGWMFGRLDPQGRKRLLFGMLLTLSALIWSLPFLVHVNMVLVTCAIGAVGFLAYGPYSLLAGILSVEIRGKEFVGTVAGAVDASGYLAGILAGQMFGKLVDSGGYRLGFRVLALTTVVSAFLCLLLYSEKGRPATTD